MNLLKKLHLRRRYIVDPPFQYNLIGRAVAFVLFTFLVMCVGLFLPLVTEIADWKGDTSGDYDTVTAFLYMHEHFWPMALICLAVAIIGVVRTSHRIAGPRGRIKRHLNSVAEGRFPRPLRTRDNDYFKHDVDILNTMVENLAAWVDELESANAELGSALEACVEDTEPSTALDTAVEKAKTLTELLARFGRESAESDAAADQPADLDGAASNASSTSEEPVLEMQS